MRETLFNRTRGIRGRVRYRQCQHGVVMIDEFTKTGNRCLICRPETNETVHIENTEGFFNIGLGCMTYGTRDAEKKAKRMGLQPIGDAKINEVFK